jgi:ATP-dependent DNA ligase
MTLPVRPPLEPMLAKLTREVPERHDCLYEPKWDGFRCVVFRDGDDLDLQSRNKRPLLRYFPELREPLLAQLPEQCVLDGELVVVSDDGLDFDSLQLRQHPADSRVRKLAAEIPATYVAFDVLAIGDESLLETPFEQRRARLVALLVDATGPIVLTPATRDPATARDWFGRFEGAGFDGVMAKPLADPYAPGQRTLIKVKHERTCDCAIAGFRIHKDGNGVGSLLLGLYDESGDLHHVGVAAAIDATRRAELLVYLEPYRDNALDDHPWREWADFMSAAREANPTRMPGGPSRWNAQKDLSWEPLRVELVAEVAYEGMMSGRFRHNARYRRMRDDRDPASCTYAQLEQVPAAELRDLFHLG